VSTEDGHRTGPLAQAGAAIASLAEAWLRDTAYVAVGLLALVTVVCGFTAADDLAHGVLGLVAGLGAFGVPTAAVVRRATASQVWVALLIGAAIGGGGLALILSA